MSEIKFESIKNKELDDTRSDLSNLEKTINPINKLANIENNSQKSYQEQQKINDTIIEKSREINTLYTIIKDNNNNINKEYYKNKKILDSKTKNEINEMNQKHEYEAKTMLKDEIINKELTLQKIIEEENQHFNERKSTRQTQVIDEINNKEKQINNLNGEIEEKEKLLKTVTENKDYKKGIEKLEKGKKLKEKEQILINEYNEIQTLLTQTKNQIEIAIQEINEIKQQSETIEKEEGENHENKKLTLKQNHEKTIMQLITDQKEQIRIASGLPSNEEILIKRENEDKQLQQDAKQETKKINEQYYIRIGQLENEIQSTEIDLQIKSLEVEALKNEKEKLMSEISGVAQPKIDFMNTTIVENSGLPLLLGNAGVKNSEEQEIINKNREEITVKANEISEKVSNEIEPEDKKAIEDAILNHLKNDLSYKNKINEIILQGTQSGKSIEEIKSGIQEYNQSMIKKLFPIFLIEIEAGKITVNRANGSQVTLGNDSKEILAKNESFQTFKKLYEKFIENPLLDLTDLNYLSREGIAENTASGLEKQLINAVGTNRDIENFLFNNPQANPETIHDNLQNVFQKPLSKKQQKKLAGLLGKTLPKDNTNRSKNQINKDNKKKQESKKTTLPPSRKDEFLDKINIFTTKRINQSLLLGHCETLRETFGLVTSQGTRLVDAIAFDFKELSIAESGNTISQNIVYQNLSSKITIDGTLGTVTIPNTLSSLRGINEMNTLTKLPLSLQKRKELLTQAATITEKELFACENWSDVQSRITEKIRLVSEKNKTSRGAEQNTIAENLEKESLVMNFTNFMSGSVNTKNTEKIHKNALSKNESNQNAMKLLLQKRTQGKEGTLPMNLQELKTLNTIFMDKKIQKLVGNNEGIPSDNWDKFFDTIGLYKRGPDATFTEIITFFTSLKDMAYSQVDHEHENGYLALQKLLNKKGFSSKLQYNQDHTVIA